jgi:hypothetical protein
MTVRQHHIIDRDVHYAPAKVTGAAEQSHAGKGSGADWRRTGKNPRTGAHTHTAPL